MTLSRCNRAQVTKLLRLSFSCPPDSHAHFLFLGTVGVAMATDSTHPKFWLHPALTLLQYTRDNIESLARDTKVHACMYMYTRRPSVK